MTHFRICMTTAVAALSALLIACSGGKKASSGNETPGETISVDAFCRAVCSQIERCPDMQGESTPESCKSECLQETSMASLALYRPEAITALRDCLASIPCDEGAGTCAEAAVRAVYPDIETALQDPLYTACRNKVTECETPAGRPFLDDLCVEGLVIVDATKSKFGTCVSPGDASPCDGVQACLCDALSLTQAACYCPSCVPSG
jgi:hypothetical protein